MPKKKSKPNLKTARSDSDAAATPARPSVVLDHTMYPQLFDEIVKNTDYGGLLRFRQTSKDMRKRADAALARHIILTRGEDRPKGRRWNAMKGYLPRGPHRLTPPDKRLMLLTADGRRLPGWVCDYGHVKDWADSCGPQCTELRQRWEQAFQSTRVVDHPRSNSHIRANITSSAEVVRVFGHRFWEGRSLGSLGSICHAKLVAFGPFAHTSEPHPPALDKIDELVFNVWYTPTDAKLEHYVARFPYFAPKTTVIFTAREKGSPWEPDCQGHQPDPDGPVGWLRLIGHRGRWFRDPDYPFPQYTIVGALPELQKYFGITDGVSRTAAEFHAEAVEVVVRHLVSVCAWRSPPMTDEESATVRSHVRFLSHEEYRNEVGEEDYAIAVDTAPGFNEEEE